MKTPMRNLMLTIDSYIIDENLQGDKKKIFENIKDLIGLQLEKEKQAIIDAYNQGIDDGVDHCTSNEQYSSEQYYKDKFNQ